MAASEWVPLPSEDVERESSFVSTLEAGGAAALLAALAEAEQEATCLRAAAAHRRSPFPASLLLPAHHGVTFRFALFVTPLAPALPLLCTRRLAA